MRISDWSSDVCSSDLIRPQIRVTVGVSGTGGGFKKFLRNEIDISNASRPISESEIELSKQNNIGFIEIPVSYDGLAIVVRDRKSVVKGKSMSVRLVLGCRRIIKKKKKKKKESN